MFGYVSSGNNSTGFYNLGIGLDSESVPYNFLSASTQGSYFYINTSIYEGLPGIGYHYLQLLEYCSAATQTVVGKNFNLGYEQSGATGWILS